jgi:hypothetical protein
MDSRNREGDAMSRKHSTRITPFGFSVRFAMTAIATVLIPPFVVLAIAPMLLILAPVALIAIPFMLSAFAGEASEVSPSPRRLRALHHAIN